MGQEEMNRENGQNAADSNETPRVEYHYYRPNSGMNTGNPYAGIPNSGTPQGNPYAGIRNTGIPEDNPDSGKKGGSFGKGFLTGLLVMLVIAGLAAGCIFGLRGSKSTITAEDPYGVLDEKTTAKMDFLETLIKLYYLYDVDENDLQDGLLKGMISALGDPYTEYYNEEETEMFMGDTTGTFCGIGVVMQEDPETFLTTIIQVYPDSPAERAGVQEGDIFYKVDGEDVSGVDSSVISSKVRGEKGTDVTIVFYRDSEEVEVVCTRDEIVAINVTGEVLEDGIGYIKVDQFAENVDDQFKTELNTLKEQDIKGLIIDLRNNPGGDVDATINMLDQLLPKELVLTMRDKDEKEETYYTEGNDVFGLPITILVNNWSASASEIFTGALKDLGAAKVVGTQTYGKGVVQYCLELGDGTMFKVTAAEYYTPSGTCIHGVGIEPDIVVELEEGDTDNQLEEAVKVTKEQM